jgi:ATP-dependent RNA helicase DeaD
MTDFDSLGIQPDILQNIQLLGFEEMTPIQRMALPPALDGRDLLGQAKTGTGKTLAFAIPLIEKIRVEERFIQALVLTPTRELAVQVGLEFEKLAGSGIRVALTYGGASMNTQIDMLRRGVHVVVGTPGRVIDHIKRGNLRLDRVETLVLDEADRMLDMGFIKDVEWIIEKTPDKRQTMLFSATLPEEIRRLSERYMRNPEFISASSDSDELTVGEVQQFYVEVDQKRKMDAFFKIVKEEKPAKALVFCKTKRWVESLYGILRRRRFSVDRIHGDLTQAARKNAIERLRHGKIQYLICTDVVARGIDISDISHVFNYDIPQEPLTYVHRVGRTARIGKEGTAITFINPSQIRDLWLIEHKARTKIQELKLESVQ